MALSCAAPLSAMLSSIVVAGSSSRIEVGTVPQLTDIPLSFEVWQTSANTRNNVGGLA